MVAKRIIPCLDVQDGRVVKGIRFNGLRQVGDPVEMGTAYAREGADELVFLDISATIEGRKTFASLVKRIAAGLDIPFTVGGGIASLDDATRLLDAGADKITLNSAALADPSLVSYIASRYGSQFVVVAIDAKKIGNAPERWFCASHGGRVTTDKELFSWAREAQERGAGEILFTSMDNDGTRGGFACELYARLHDTLSIPIIASGGAGSIGDIVEVLTKGKADAALAASIFHYGEISIRQIKEALREAGVPVRMA